MLKLLSTELLKRRYSLLILDEAHSIRNETIAIRKLIMQLAVQHRLALTGTPIQNSVGDIMNILEYLNPTIFNFSKTEKELFLNNELFEKEQLTNLSEIIEPFIVRRLKGGEVPPVHYLTLFCK